MLRYDNIKPVACEALVLRRRPLDILETACACKYLFRTVTCLQELVGICRVDKSTQDATGLKVRLAYRPALTYVGCVGRVRFRLPGSGLFEETWEAFNSGQFNSGPRQPGTLTDGSQLGGLASPPT